MNKIWVSILLTTLSFAACEPKKASDHHNHASLPDPLAAGWEGQSVCAILEENESVRVLKCTFPPGVGHERHYHPKHFGYTLKGGKFEITDTTGTREVNITTGYDFFNDSIVWHQVKNVGSDTAIFLIMEPK